MVKKLKETEITSDSCQMQCSEVKDKLVLPEFAITLSNNYLIVHKCLQFF